MGQRRKAAGKFQGENIQMEVPLIITEVGE